MTPLADDPERQSIRSDLDGNLLVEAAAGSGKTESLAQRMAEGVLRGVYRLEGLAAVTFTRKAAAELRHRFHKVLRERLKEGVDPQARARGERALANPEELFAGTIHSFCARLLRERPVEAGVSPGFEELEEAQDAELRGQAWRRFLDEQRQQDSDLIRAVDRCGVKPADLRGALDVLCLNSDVDFPPGEAAPPDPAAVETGLRDFHACLVRLMPAEPRPRACGFLRRARRFRERYQELAHLPGDRRLPELARLAAEWEADRDTLQPDEWTDDRKRHRPLKDELFEARSNLQQTARPFLAGWRARVYGQVMPLLLEARSEVERARLEQARLNYQDLLLLTARLLRERPRVRRALQGKFRWLLVDEFQDTDPVQAEILFLLAAEDPAESDGPADWTALRLRPGALFIVGDPKQSIYRFRRADIDTYRLVRRRIQEEGGRVLTLTTSFRSGPVLLDWCNQVFASVFSDPAGSQAEHQPLHPYRDPEPPERAGVRTLSHPARTEAEELSELEAARIAAFIREEVEQRRRRPGDFLILTRVRGPLKHYAAALERLGVACELTGGQDFHQNPVVELLCDLLEGLCDPDDALALVRLLRGPLFGISDPELYAHRRGGHFRLQEDAHDTVPEEEANCEKGTGSPAHEGEAGYPVRRALDRLGALRELCLRLPPTAAVERLLEETGLLAWAAASHRGGAGAGHLMRALDLVRQVAARGGTLAEAAAALRAGLEDLQAESRPLEPGRSRVVRVMNLHQAKGLEAPVVFLAAPHRGSRGGVSLRVVRATGSTRAQGYLEVRHRWDLLAHPLDWDRHQEEEAAYVQAEERRLLYVAATRARDLLVVSKWDSRDGRYSRPWQELAPHLPRRSELPRAATEEAAGATGEGSRTVAALPTRGQAWRTSGAGGRAAAEALPTTGDGTRTAPEEAARTALPAAPCEQDFRDRWQELARPSYRQGSVTAEVRAREQTPRFSGLKLPEDLRGEGGAEWGTLVHRLLEQAMRRPELQPEALLRLARWYACEHEALSLKVQEAVDLVERIRATEFWQQATRARERLVEVPFGLALLDDQGRPVLVRGSLDLALEGEAGWSVVDYKTDRQPLDDLVTRYAPQVLEYAHLWQLATGVEVSYAGLFGLRELRLSEDLR